MNRLENMRNKKIGIYMRKQSPNENLSTGYGRLQWLRYELEDHKGRIDVYIDEPSRRNKFDNVINDLENGKIEVLLLWDIKEFEDVELQRIINICVFSQVEIVSFYKNMHSMENISELCRF